MGRSGSSSSDLRSASARDVCSTRGELHCACSQLHCTSTSGDVRCAAPSHVRGCCSRGDVRRGSGQLRGSTTDRRDLLSYVTFLLPQRQLTSLRGPTAFSHAHVRFQKKKKKKKKKYSAYMYIFQNKATVPL